MKKALITAMSLSRTQADTEKLAAVLTSAVVVALPVAPSSASAWPE